MKAPALDKGTRTPLFPANDETNEQSQKLKQSMLNWRETPKSLLHQRFMRTAKSYPTLVAFGADVKDDTD